MMNADKMQSEESNGSGGRRRGAVHRPQDGLNVADADRAIRAFVNERPFVAVGLAMAAGYLMARSINAIR